MISLMRPRVPLKTAVGIALCAIALVEAANLPSLARGRATAPTAMPINAGPGAFVFRLERSYRERLLFEGKINGDDRLAFALTDRSATAPVVLWHDPGEFQASLVGATAVVSGVLYFVTWEYSHGFFGTLSRTTLWRSNGTPDGTMAVTTLPCLDVDLTAAAGLLFFCCGGVWRSDGTAAGTVQLQTVNAITQVFNLAATERGIFFESASGAVMEVWWSDGTTQATKALASFPYDYNEGFLTVLGERAVFGVGQHDLWISDGTPAGTTRFAMSPDPLPGVLGSVSVVDNRAFFTSIGEVPGRGQRGTLWVTDGTASGTLRVADFPCRESYDCSLLGIAGVGGRLLFSAFDEHTGYELWRTVGKRARSHLLVDLRPGPDSSAPEDLIPVNSRLFFMVHSDVFNQDDDQTSLWMTDGSRAGTVRVDGFHPREFPSLQALDDGRLVFTTDDGSGGVQWWMTTRYAPGCRGPALADRERRVDRLLRRIGGSASPPDARRDLAKASRTLAALHAGLAERRAQRGISACRGAVARLEERLAALRR